jgi:predicted deacylase
MSDGMDECFAESAAPGSAAGVFEGLDRLPARSRHNLFVPVTSMPDGTTLSIAVNVAVGTSYHPALLAVAAHHGDEHEGPTALIDVWHRIEPNNLSGSVIAVPVLNPLAFRAGKRWSDEDLVDINRIFPGSDAGTVTHRLARVFMDRLASQADFILSMHGWSAGYLVQPYTEFPRDGRNVRESWEGAVAFGLPYLNPLDAGPGRLMTEAGARGLPLIEVEIGGQGTSMAERRRLYEVGMWRLMRHMGIVSTVDTEAIQAPIYIDRVECTAPIGGLMRPEVGVGDNVERGQHLAVIYDLNLRAKAVVESPCAGVVGVLRLSASTLPGQLVATIFQKIDWQAPQTRDS